MNRIIFLFLSLFPVCLQAQKLTFRVLHNADPVPYVSVIDSASGIFGYTDENGILSVNNGSYSVKFSHVSYRDTVLRLHQPLNDSTITIQLTMKSTVLDTVMIGNLKIDRNRIYSAGAYDRKSSNGIIERYKSFIGIVFDEVPEGPKYLRSIKFRLQENDFTPYPFVVELKVYGINSERILSPSPLNVKPIYIRSGELARKNEIFLEQNIRIPDGGVFISVELPERFDEEYDDVIRFMATTGSTHSKTYQLRNKTGEWPREILQTKGLPWQAAAKPFMELCWSVTFWKAK